MAQGAGAVSASPTPSGKLHVETTQSTPQAGETARDSAKIVDSAGAHENEAVDNGAPNTFNFGSQSVQLSTMREAQPCADAKAP